MNEDNQARSNLRLVLAITYEDRNDADLSGADLRIGMTAVLLETVNCFVKSSQTDSVVHMRGSIIVEGDLVHYAWQNAGKGE